jgi:hypothetical protein
MFSTENKGTKFVLFTSFHFSERSSILKENPTTPVFRCLSEVAFLLIETNRINNVMQIKQARQKEEKKKKTKNSLLKVRTIRRANRACIIIHYGKNLGFN